MPTARVIKRKPQPRPPTSYPGLKPREARALDRFRQELRAILPNGELVSLYLYGSKPRGDAKPHSDIDIFLVYDDVTTEQEKALQDLSLEHLSKPVQIHLMLLSAEGLARANGSNSLIYNVSHQGILLEGLAVTKREINRPVLVSQFLKKAHDNFELATVALDKNDYDNTISLSYYAAYYAAGAALASKGLVAESHSGTETLLTLHFIRTGLLPDKFKGLLGGGHTARIQADYPNPETLPFTREKAEYWFTRTQEFVQVIKASLEGWLSEPPIKP